MTHSWYLPFSLSNSLYVKLLPTNNTPSLVSTQLVLVPTNKTPSFLSPLQLCPTTSMGVGTPNYIADDMDSSHINSSLAILTSTIFPSCISYAGPRLSRRYSLIAPSMLSVRSVESVQVHVEYTSKKV